MSPRREPVEISVKTLYKRIGWASPTARERGLRVDIDNIGTQGSMGPEVSGVFAAPQNQTIKNSIL